MMRGNRLVCVTISSQSEALSITLTTMKMYYSTYSHHSLRRGVGVGVGEGEEEMTVEE